MKRLIGHWGNFIILSLIILGVYSPALFTFLAQDDFTHLAISQTNSIKGVLGFFNFKTQGIYYRPLSVQLITFLARSAFGLRPFWWHGLALGLHLIVVAVVYRLLKKLLADDRLALVGTAFYGIHPVHFMSLFWWAEISMVMAPLAGFLAILAWLSNKHRWFLIFFLLGILSNELAVSVILIAFLVKHDWKRLMPAGIIALAIIGGRWLIQPPGLGTEYGMKFTPQVMLENSRWQIARALGFPEGFWGQLGSPLVVTSVLLVGLTTAILMLGIIVRRKFKFAPLLWLGMGWFGAAVLPVVFLEHHQSPIYQIIGLPGFFLMISQVLRGKPNWLINIWLGLFILGSLLAIRGMQDYHWVTQRAREAKYYIAKLEQKQVQDGDTVVFINSRPESSTRAYIALGAGNGAKVWFGNKTQVYFEDFGLPNLNETIKIHYVVSDF